MKVTNKINIHLDDKRLLQPIDVMQGDAYTRNLEFSLYSEGAAWDVPEDVSVAVAYHGASGHGIYDTLQDDTTMAYTVSGNVVTVTLIPQVTAVAGHTTVTVLFTDANKQLATFGVIVRVVPNPAIGAGKPQDYYNIRQWIGAGPLYVNVVSDGAGGYVADKTMGDIQDADESGRAVYCALETSARECVTLPMVKLYGGVFYFSAVCEGMEWLVTLTSGAEDSDSAAVTVTRLEHARVLPNDGISFTSAAEEVSFSLRGSGTVRVFGGNVHQTVKLMEDECAKVSVVNTAGTVYIDGISGITELDIHGQGVECFTVNAPCDLNKLVIYDNNLTGLDCSNCKQLQFLHIHNNPMCDDDAYKDNLIACMRSLPNRFIISTGSIVLYPWYGLEVLICKDMEGNYIKYPAGFSALTFEEGSLYGVVEDNSITYYTYENGGLQLHSAMNRHHSLRKQLEADVCLKKNWIFGSAIMYSADWSKCPWDFRYSHIADMWETAEKGFGLTWGSFDSFTNTLCGFRHFNVKDFRSTCVGDATDDELPPALDYTDPSAWEGMPSVDEYGNPNVSGYDEYLMGSWTHGDHFFSLLSGNGEEENGEVQRFGYVPNSCCCLVDEVQPTGEIGVQLGAISKVIQFLTRNCDTITLSTNLPTHIDYDFSDVRRHLGVFGESHVYVNAGGNHGDGRPYTADRSGAYANLGGNYTIENEDGSLVEKQTSTIFVGAATPNKRVSGFSSSCSDTEQMNTGRETYLYYYGEQIFAFNNYTRKWKTVAGTSDATPLCCGMLMLMRVIYSKMFPGETSFGKHSNFMNHVRNRWCDHAETQMDFAAGYGFPNIFAEPYASQLLGEAPKVEYLDTVMLGDAMDISYAAQKYAKQGYTTEYRPGQIAVTRDEKIYPLFAGSRLGLSLYSNSSQKEPGSYTENYYASHIEVDVLPNDVGEVGGSLPLTETALSNDYLEETVIRISDTSLTDKEFTVQFALDFSDKLYPADTGEYETSRDLLYFINGPHVGRLLLDKISYTSGNAYVTLNGSSRFDHGYFDSLTEQVTSNAMGIGLGKVLDLAVMPYGIVTMTCSKDGVDYFFNGTHIGHIVNVPKINIKVSDVFVNKETLCHDAAGCVRIYNRVLTDEEIVQNTICLLNSHFEEG